VLAFLLEPELLEMHLANLEPARTESALESDLAVAEKKRRQIERQVKSVSMRSRALPVGSCSGP
jgi:hypothetical protein